MLAAAVAEDRLLGPPADLVDHRVGQLRGCLKSSWLSEAAEQEPGHG
jgi:hypothetical protein